MAVLHLKSEFAHKGLKSDMGKPAKKKILVVGGGGREHAIVDALSHSISVGKIFCAPGNAGIASQAECVPIKDDDIEALKKFAIEHHIDMTVVGPEIPLSAGIVDVFKNSGLNIFGPSAAAARIESSKDFAKRIMVKYGVPTASYKTFEDYSEAIEYVSKGNFPIVIKYDGLAAGKGVVIPENLHEAEGALKDMLLDDKFGKGKVVIEEFLTGPEFSFMCFVDGANVWPMAMAQDHKRAFDGDKGPNTGGMGAYSPVPFITKEDEKTAIEKIMRPVAVGLVKEGCPFKGVLYGGLIKTPSGIKVIEFNCRFGDPETEVVLPRLETDIYEIFNAVAGNMPDCSFPELKWSDDSVMGFVLASKGYPGAYRKGYSIKGIENAVSDMSVSAYHMGTSFASGSDVVVSGSMEIRTAGGRVLMIVARGATLQEAHKKALTAVGKIECDNLFFRKDIGWRVL